MEYLSLMAKQTSLFPRLDYATVVLTEGQIEALAWFLGRPEVERLLSDLDPYVNESLLMDGYLGLYARINRVRAKLEEQHNV